MKEVAKKLNIIEGSKLARSLNAARPKIVFDTATAPVFREISLRRISYLAYSDAKRACLCTKSKARFLLSQDAESITVSPKEAIPAGTANSRVSERKVA
jgi:hypothetical protein